MQQLLSTKHTVYPNSTMSKEKQCMYRYIKRQKNIRTRTYTDINKGKDGKTALEWSMTNVTEGLNLVKGRPASDLFYIRPI